VTEARSPIRVGILGTGWAAGRHAEAVRRLPGVELAAVAGRDPAAAQRFAELRDVASAHGSAEALLADPSIDAVHICTINAVHAEQAREALAAGKHVLCEKPLGVVAGETAELVALADEARHERGLLADLKTLHSERHRPARARETFTAAVDGETQPVAITTEDFGTVMLRFDSDARGSFVVSQTSAGHKNELTIDVDCAEASIAWQQERPERAWIGRRGGPNVELVRDPAALDLPADTRSTLPAGHPEGWNDALLELVSAFYATVRAARAGREHASSLATFADGHRVVQLVDAIIDSHERGGWVAVGRPIEVGT
jgi:predicted dehydrogenase